jgi:hypothetical protein
MRTIDFNDKDVVMLKYTHWDKDYNKIVEKIISEIALDIRGRRMVKVDGVWVHLKNFKKDNSVKGSTGMIRSKSGKSWLNNSIELLGGIDYIRDEKLNQIFN